MMLIDFKDNKYTAFKKAFMKGMAAPVMLFGAFEMPECDQVPLIDIVAPRKSIVDDMETVKHDFVRAIQHTK
jgi:hypothetical protein